MTSAPTRRWRGCVSGVGEDLVLRVTANKLDKGSFCLPSLRWLIDNRPELVARAYKMLMPSGYIIQKLTGKLLHEAAPG